MASNAGMHRFNQQVGSSVGYGVFQKEGSITSKYQIDALKNPAVTGVSEGPLKDALQNAGAPVITPANVSDTLPHSVGTVQEFFSTATPKQVQEYIVHVSVGRSDGHMRLLAPMQAAEDEIPGFSVGVLKFGNQLPTELAEGVSSRYLSHTYEKRFSRHKRYGQAFSLTQDHLMTADGQKLKANYILCLASNATIMAQIVITSAILRCKDIYSAYRKMHLAPGSMAEDSLSHRILEPVGALHRTTDAIYELINFVRQCGRRAGAPAFTDILCTGTVFTLLAYGNLKETEAFRRGSKAPKILEEGGDFFRNATIQGLRFVEEPEYNFVRSGREGQNRTNMLKRTIEVGRHYIMTRETMVNKDTSVPFSVSADLGYLNLDQQDGCIQTQKYTDLLYSCGCFGSTGELHSVYDELIQGNGKGFKELAEELGAPKPSEGRVDPFVSWLRDSAPKKVKYLGEQDIYYTNEEDQNLIVSKVTDIIKKHISEEGYAKILRMIALAKSWGTFSAPEDIKYAEAFAYATWACNIFAGATTATTFTNFPYITILNGVEYLSLLPQDEESIVCTNWLTPGKLLFLDPTKIGDQVKLRSEADIIDMYTKITGPAVQSGVLDDASKKKVTEYGMAMAKLFDFSPDFTLTSNLIASLNHKTHHGRGAKSIKVVPAGAAPTDGVANQGIAFQSENTPANALKAHDDAATFAVDPANPRHGGNCQDCTAKLDLAIPNNSQIARRFGIRVSKKKDCLPGYTTASALQNIVHTDGHQLLEANTLDSIRIGVSALTTIVTILQDIFSTDDAPNYFFPTNPAPMNSVSLKYNPFLTASKFFFGSQHDSVFQCGVSNYDFKENTEKGIIHGDLHSICHEESLGLNALMDFVTGSRFYRDQVTRWILLHNGLTQADPTAAHNMDVAINNALVTRSKLVNSAVIHAKNAYGEIYNFICDKDKYTQWLIHGRTSGGGGGAAPSSLFYANTATLLDVTKGGFFIPVDQANDTSILFLVEPSVLDPESKNVLDGGVTRSAGNAGNISEILGGAKRPHELGSHRVDAEGDAFVNAMAAALTGRTYGEIAAANIPLGHGGGNLATPVLNRCHFLRILLDVYDKIQIGRYRAFYDNSSRLGGTNGPLLHGITAATDKVPKPTAMDPAASLAKKRAEHAYDENFSANFFGLLSKAMARDAKFTGFNEAVTTEYDVVDFVLAGIVLEYLLDCHSLVKKPTADEAVNDVLTTWIQTNTAPQYNSYEISIDNALRAAENRRRVPGAGDANFAMNAIMSARAENPFSVTSDGTCQSRFGLSFSKRYFSNFGNHVKSILHGVSNLNAIINPAVGGDFPGLNATLAGTVAPVAHFANFAADHEFKTATVEHLEHIIGRLFRQINDAPELLSHMRPVEPTNRPGNSGAIYGREMSRHRLLGICTLPAVATTWQPHKHGHEGFCDNMSDNPGTPESREQIGKLMDEYDLTTRTGSRKRGRPDKVEYRMAGRGLYNIPDQHDDDFYGNSKDIITLGHQLKTIAETDKDARMLREMQGKNNLRDRLSDDDEKPDFSSPWWAVRTRLCCDTDSYDGGIRRLAVLAYCGARVHRDVFLRMYKNDVPPPIGFLVVDLFIKLVTSAMVFVASAEDTGRLSWALPDFSDAYNGENKIHTYSLTFMMGALVARPENIFIYPDAVFEGYCGGGSGKLIRTGIADADVDSSYSSFMRTKTLDIDYNHKTGRRRGDRFVFHIGFSRSVRDYPDFIPYAGTLTNPNVGFSHWIPPDITDSLKEGMMKMAYDSAFVCSKRYALHKTSGTKHVASNQENTSFMDQRNSLRACNTISAIADQWVYNKATAEYSTQVFSGQGALGSLCPGSTRALRGAAATVEKIKAQGTGRMVLAY